MKIQEKSDKYWKSDPMQKILSQDGWGVYALQFWWESAGKLILQPTGKLSAVMTRSWSHLLQTVFCFRHEWFPWLNPLPIAEIEPPWVWIVRKLRALPAPESFFVVFFWKRVENWVYLCHETFFWQIFSCQLPNFWNHVTPNADIKHILPEVGIMDL